VAPLRTPLHRLGWWEFRGKTIPVAYPGFQFLWYKFNLYNLLGRELVSPASCLFEVQCMAFEGYNHFIGLPPRHAPWTVHIMVCSSLQNFIFTGAWCRPCWTRNRKPDRVWNIWGLTYPSAFTNCSLFRNILANGEHILHHYIPQRTTLSQCRHYLRPRNKELIPKTRTRNNKDFIVRMLYKDMSRPSCWTVGLLYCIVV